jgi:DNA recombination protein RmuC
VKREVQKVLEYIIIALIALAVVLTAVLLAKYRSAGQEIAALNRQLKLQTDMLFDALSKQAAQNADNAARERQDIAEQFTRLNQLTVASMGEISRLSERNSDRLRQSVEERLAEMQKTVDERLQKSLHEGISASFTRVSEQLTELYKSMGEVKTLTSGVGDLKNILSNVKNRGTWGEVQLSRLLEDFMAPGQYMQNARINTETVEFAIVLPGEDEPVYLPIDSKFPMDRYARVVSAEGEALAAAQKDLERAIMEEAKKINAKYIHPPRTTDFAVMFLPSEGLYAEVLRRSLLEVLQRKYKIMVTGPSTLCALLTSLQTGFKTLAIKKHSNAILDMLTAVKNEFERFEDYIEKTQNSLRVAQGHLENVSKRSAKIQNKLGNVGELKELE